MKKITFILFLLFCLKLQAAPPDSSGVQKKHRRTLHMYSYGLAAYSWAEGNPTECEAAVEKKYGLDYVPKAGCVVRTFQVMRWDFHNYFVDRKLTRRFGKDWYDQFKKDMGECNRKN